MAGVRHTQPHTQKMPQNTLTFLWNSAFWLNHNAPWSRNSELDREKQPNTCFLYHLETIPKFLILKFAINPVEGGLSNRCHPLGQSDLVQFIFSSLVHAGAMLLFLPFFLFSDLNYISLAGTNLSRHEKKQTGWADCTVDCSFCWNKSFTLSQR